MTPDLKYGKLINPSTHSKSLHPRSFRSNKITRPLNIEKHDPRRNLLLGANYVSTPPFISIWTHVKRLDKSKTLLKNYRNLLRMIFFRNHRLQRTRG